MRVACGSVRVGTASSITGLPMTVASASPTSSTRLVSIVDPTAASIFSTQIKSSGATLYCVPPKAMTAKRDGGPSGGAAGAGVSAALLLQRRASADAGARTPSVAATGERSSDGTGGRTPGERHSRERSIVHQRLRVR